MTRQLAPSPQTVDTLTGVCAAPSANGELVFAAPHEARLFAMAHSLVQAGVFDWATFRAALIVAIEEADSAAAADARTETAEGAEDVGDAVKRPVPHGLAPAYYVCFALALEHLLALRGLILSETLAARTHLLAARPAGHDHALRAAAARGIDVATK